MVMCRQLHRRFGCDGTRAIYGKRRTFLAKTYPDDGSDEKEFVEH
eukprot:CAMPEP_0183728676 /NCGR_PEP_ID=MMETSP0737-20130205/28639_1 /TAXON_ID=385413 /ORGANISM="Thalassiosira miniscula, Strain CCMP1093" /LENGTH=44 /DNA_ID= /DNA_START= /DNA_END= /DNA_ORIENTATION=